MFRLTERSNLSHADVVLFGLGYATLIFTVGYYVTGLHDAFRTGFAIEDGPVEWGTAVCLLLFTVLHPRLRTGAADGDATDPCDATGRGEGHDAAAE